LFESIAHKFNVTAVLKITILPCSTFPQERQGF
jgi:hypothetical protein